jgi:hypothetical protein
VNCCRRAHIFGGSGGKKKRLAVALSFWQKIEGEKFGHGER